jgi:parallel beta-helix repeat protein
MSTTIQTIHEGVVMRMPAFFLAILLLIICTATVQAKIIHVPGDSTTIQGGINGAVSGDTVMVHPGTFHEHDIDFFGKAITVTGTDPEDSAVVASTVVDGDSLGRVFVFQSEEDSASVLAGLTITGGYAYKGGGILCSESSPKIIRNVIKDNDAFGGWDEGGGGMCNIGSSPTVSNCTFSSNSANRFGGGMSNSDNSNPKVANCTFSINRAYYRGGGIYCEYDSSPTVNNCTFRGNITHGYGGGIYNGSSYSTLTVTNCTFSGNSAEDSGGGIYNGSSYGTPTVTNCTFSGNSAEVSGGGICNGTRGTSTITNCTFSGNSAEVSGGGMYNGYSSTPTVSNCTFSSNTAWDGGGMHNIESSPIITNNTFFENSALFGGGMNNEDNSSPTVINCVLNGNSAQFYGGGVYNWFHSTPTFTNCTISGNSAQYYGGGMLNWQSSPIITNCILWANIGGSIYNVASIPIVTYSNLEGGYTGEGNIDTDPRFVTFKGFEYLLHPKSPCVDAGDPAIEDALYDWHPKWPDNYPNGSCSDMGAYGGPGNINWLP